MNALWIDALSFSRPGGWTEETQFAHEMGLGYLLAIGVPGVPVGQACTDMAIPADGRYRVWVRTKNWLLPDSPGRFRLLVDQQRLPRELGKLPTDRWNWEVAGDVDLCKGQHEFAVEDLSGYFARFAALLVVDDMDFTPPYNRDEIQGLRAQLLGLPTEIQDGGAWDVIIAGAGPAGSPAAIAAA